MGDLMTLPWTTYPASRFASLACAWDEVSDHAGGVPFLSSTFVGHALRAFGTGQELVAMCGSSAEPLALAIVVCNRPGVWQTFQPSQLPLGAWVMRRGLDYEAAAQALMAALPGLPALLAITQQDPALHRRPDNGRCLSTIDYIDTGWIDLRGSFDEYWSARGKGLRQNIRTHRSKIARCNGTATLEVFTQPERVDAVLEGYARLESAGWKGRAGTAVRMDTPQGRFYADVLKDLCRAGIGHLCVYRINEEIAAIDLNIVQGEIMVLLKTTYDESLQGLSPSSLLREDLLRRIFGAGTVKRLEFYGPAMEWTYRWTDQVRKLFHVNIYRFGALRALHAAMRARRS